LIPCASTVLEPAAVLHLFAALLLRYSTFLAIFTSTNLLAPTIAMAGTASPGGDGPTYAPPQLPPGWIAQWDGASKKYYFVQLSTGVSQWDTPTDPAPVGGGGTPAEKIEHPYGVPGQPQLITHPDGTQTVKHADGTMEPILPPGDSARGVDGPDGERGLGVCFP
jgi:hypothetical protein